MNEQDTQEINEEDVQNRKKGRSQAEKYGRLRWSLTLLERQDKRLDKIEASLRIILNGLEGAGYFRYNVPFLEKAKVFRDAVDVAIVDKVREVGVQGVLPKDVASDSRLKQFSLRYWHVSRRIERMNRRVETETGKCLFEKHGHKWALTSWAFEVWGKTEGETKEDEEQGQA